MALLGDLPGLTELDIGGNRISKDACAVLLAMARKKKSLNIRLEEQHDHDAHEDPRHEHEADAYNDMAAFGPNQHLLFGGPLPFHQYAYNMGLDDDELDDDEDFSDLDDEESDD